MPTDLPLLTADPGPDRRAFLLDPLDALTPQASGSIEVGTGGVEWEFGYAGLSSVVLTSPALVDIDPDELDCLIETGLDGPILVCGVGIRGRRLEPDFNAGPVVFAEAGRSVWAAVLLGRVAVAPAVAARLTDARAFSYRAYVGEPQVGDWFLSLAEKSPLERDPRFRRLGALGKSELLRLSREVGAFREGHPTESLAHLRALRGAVTLELAALLP